VRDKEQLAQRLLELQTSNQQRMTLLEKQMSGMAARGTVSTPSSSASAARFVTPARADVASSSTGTSAQYSQHAYTPAPSSNSKRNNFQSHAALDPSSPFVGTWTSSGLSGRAAPRTATAPASHLKSTPTSGMAAPPSTRTDSRARTRLFDTPARTIANVLSATPAMPLPVEVEAAAALATEAVAASAAALAHAQMHASPLRVAASSSTSALSSPTRSSTSVVSSPREANGASTVGACASSPSLPVSPASFSGASRLSSTAVDALLLSLDARHQSQLADFELAEAEWAARLEEIEAQRRELQLQVEEADTGRAKETRPLPAAEALQVTLTLHRDSILFRTAAFTYETAKVVVPVAATAYAAVKAYRYYSSFVRRT
jgi:hypothetical protein